MPAKINLLNQRFGKLLVIEQTNKKKNKSIVWKCKCDCGNIEQFSTKELRNDGVIQCHQCGNHREPKKIKESLIGKKFNRLTVLEPTKKRSGGKIVYKCLCQCGNYAYTTKTDLQNGHTQSCGCLKKKYQVGDIINNKQIISFQPLKEQHKNINKHLYYRCKCLLCGREYDALANTLQKSYGCGCLKSIGQNNIKQILDKFNISYIREYSFPKSLYRFDFAILDKNQKVIRLIQFDGQQHYKQNIKNSGWNTIQHYQKVVQSDKNKNLLAKENNIPLIRIPYWERENLNIQMLLKDYYLVE